MKTKVLSFFRFGRILIVLLVLLFAVSSGLAQKADLISAFQSAAKVAQSGEKFVVASKATNIGSQSADAAYVNLRLEYSQSASFSAATPSQGTCEFYEHYNVKDEVICRFGELKAGASATVEIEITVRHFGDISQLDKDVVAKSETMTDSARIAFSDLQRKLGRDDQSQEFSIRAECGSSMEANIENGISRIRIRAFPSKNIPPRVELISPKNGEVFTRSPNQPTKITFIIKAFDPDGTIESVGVDISDLTIRVDESQRSYIFEGKKYPVQEVLNNSSVFGKYFVKEATKTGKDTYNLTIENPNSGNFRIYLGTTDNAGRKGGAEVNIKVEDKK